MHLVVTKVFTMCLLVTKAAIEAPQMRTLACQQGVPLLVTMQTSPCLPTKHPLKQGSILTARFCFMFATEVTKLS